MSTDNTTGQSANAPSPRDRQSYEPPTVTLVASAHTGCSETEPLCGDDLPFDRLDASVGSVN
jgi:hypothetical protein